MANWIEAVNRYRPRVTNAPTIDIDFLAERLAVGALITRPLARMVLEELGREVAGLLRTGHKVRLPGIGTLAPHVRLGGRMHPAIRLSCRRTARRPVGGREGWDGRKGHLRVRCDRNAVTWRERRTEEAMEPGSGEPSGMAPRFRAGRRRGAR